MHSHDGALTQYIFYFPQSWMTLSISLSLFLNFVPLSLLVLRSLLPKREWPLETSVRIKNTTPASFFRHDPPSCLRQLYLLLATFHHSFPLYIHTYPFAHVFALSLTKNRHITLLLSCQHPYVYVINRAKGDDGWC